ncbi:DUF6343 family protein [Streptomyces chattanoogensis]|uniref:DUF6343 family protein n=1 Tax=Streptomyces chattanoogensis TaxID=66876 RepID=UPI0036D190B6
MKRPRTGTEPVTARSPLRLRLILASAALVAFAAGTLRFAIGASTYQPHDSPGLTVRLVLAVVCGVLAILAAVDLVVVLRRCRNDRNAGASR